jgi:thiamine biosynthesis lipoprotein
MTRFLCFLLLALFIGCEERHENPPTELILRGKALGTTWTVKVRSPAPPDEEELRADITAKIDEKEKILSHWRPDSELYRFNANLSTNPVFVPALLHQLLKHAQWMHRQTKGAFDPSIAPLVNLWGFGPVSGNRSAIPTGVEIDRALRQTGLEKLEILPKDKVRKKRPDLQIDLSASAKGEIIDQVCSMLDRWGLKHYLVEIGGELRAKGNGKSGDGWQVALGNGSEMDAQDPVIVPLRNYAVATSGTYRQNKLNPSSTKPASHLLDPRTGRPVQHDLVAVNVLAPTARDADAWATALMILGPEEGMSKAKEMDLMARFCIREGNRTRHAHTPAFERLFPEAAE